MKKLLATSLAFALTMIAQPGFAKDPQLAINAADTTRLAFLDDSCRDQLKLQRPSALKNIFLTALRNAPGAMLGGFVGSAAAGFAPKGSPVSNTDYGIYNGVATVGSSIGGGITGYEMGKHYAQGVCMIEFVRRAARERAGLRNVVIIPNAFQVNGHAVRGPDGKKVGKGDYFVLLYPEEHPVEDASFGDDSSVPPPPQQ